MAYAWSPELETGNSAIDSQHKELVAALNRLLDACAAGQGRAEIAATLKFLNDYVATHFRDEELLQQRARYPDIAAHRKSHEEFKAAVRQVMLEFEKGGATVALVSKLNSTIAMWLISHIKKDDVKVAQYLTTAR